MNFDGLFQSSDSTCDCFPPNPNSSWVKQNDYDWVNRTLKENGWDHDADSFVSVSAQDNVVDLNYSKVRYVFSISDKIYSTSNIPLTGML